MLPTAITLRNYRAFADPVRLELRPVTLLFGNNNAGKSALLRALPILSDSVAAEARGPLDLESPAARGSTFQELRWKGVGEDEDPDLGVGLVWSGTELEHSFEVRLTWFEPWKRLIVRRFYLRDGAGRELLEGEWRPEPRHERAAELAYQIRIAQDPQAHEAAVVFRGLVPESVLGVEGVGELLGPIVERLRALRGQVQWLAAVRSTPARIQPYPAAPRWRVKPDGSDATALLAAQPEVLAEVSQWYEQHLGRRLYVQEVAPGSFRLTLRNLLRAELDVDLADCGEGMVQVLPVLTALALGRRASLGGPAILAIEEPESHLHPSLQRALAEKIGEVAMSDGPPRIVLETHSEHLLLGIQREVVLGHLRPEDVAIYWVRQLEGGQSVADLVTLDRDARPQGHWPPEIFSDDTEVAREIIQARRERSEA